MGWYKQQKIRSKEKYEELKSKGICTDCRKEKATPGFIKCDACREKDRKRAQLYRSGKAIRTKRNAYDTLPFNKKTTDTLNDMYEEVTKYNKEHGSAYSYGYYSALKFRGLTGKIKKE